jgi:hypothetical protein
MARALTIRASTSFKARARLSSVSASLSSPTISTSGTLGFPETILVATVADVAVVAAVADVGVVGCSC